MMSQLNSSLKNNVMEDYLVTFRNIGYRSRKGRLQNDLIFHNCYFAKSIFILYMHRKEERINTKILISKIAYE